MSNVNPPYLLKYEYNVNKDMFLRKVCDNLFLIILTLFMALKLFFLFIYDGIHRLVK